MFLLIICLYASLMLSLPQCTYQSCVEGTPRQCLDAEFAPGTNLAGEGFDITKMERKGAFVLDMNQWKRKDKTCTLCSNPYLENKKQKLPLSVVDWRPKQSCSMKVASTLHRSSESLVSSSTSSVDNNWQVNLDLKVGSKGASLMLAGTHSKLADYSMEKTKNDKFSFTSHSMSCEFYSYRVSGTSKLHREFRKAVKELPKIYSPEYKQQFYKLIDNFGTHYISKVKLGGSVLSVTSIRQCQASLQGLSLEEVAMCLKVEASASVKVSIKTQTEHCKKDIEKTGTKSAFSSLFNDRFTEIKGGYTTEPDLDNNWDDDLLGNCEQNLSAGVKEDLCNLHHGKLFYKWEVKCAPSLSGDLCADYKPSPMSQSLKKLYVSRHAHPVPKAILLEMGVFVDETSSQNNLSRIAETQKFGMI
ncbi:perforin-1-like [Etheostoma cragini]|uniref:perforin-1-like n=1 Tax=Etheostoma cragini TaxID=417921 RepID=UPI00155F1631|nr:perforin-1-like [Etheostoma cragini]